jgi:hypothetical protein
VHQLLRDEPETFQSYSQALEHVFLKIDDYFREAVIYAGHENPGGAPHALNATQTVGEPELYDQDGSIIRGRNSTTPWSQGTPTKAKGVAAPDEPSPGGGKGANRVKVTNAEKRKRKKERDAQNASERDTKIRRLESDLKNAEKGKGSGKGKHADLPFSDPSKKKTFNGPIANIPAADQWIVKECGRKFCPFWNSKIGCKHPSCKAKHHCPKCDVKDHKLGECPKK